MDKETIKRLNHIINNTETSRVPMEYIKTFIITDLDDNTHRLTRDEFYDLLDSFEDYEEDFPFELSFILDYRKIRTDIKKVTDEILEEG